MIFAGLNIGILVGLALSVSAFVLSFASEVRVRPASNLCNAAAAAAHHNYYLTNNPTVPAAALDHAHSEEGIQDKSDFASHITKAVTWCT